LVSGDFVADLSVTSDTANLFANFFQFVTQAVQDNLYAFLLHVHVSLFVLFVLFQHIF
jgi:hypothetical protein